MPEAWTATLVGTLHAEGLTQKMLAKEAGVTPEYLSMVLNGHRNPVGAEEKLTAALERLVDGKRG